MTHDLMTLAGFLGGEILTFMWPLVTAVFVIIAGAAVVAQEVERGTAALWLSAPESRVRLLTAKLAALVVGILVVVLATLEALVLGVRLVGVTLTIGGVLALGQFWSRSGSPWAVMPRWSPRSRTRGAGLPVSPRR